MRLLSTSILTALALSAATAAQAQITSNPIPAPIEKRGLAVEIKDLVRLPDTRGAASGRSGRDAGRLGARQLRARSARRPPLRQRLARLPVPARREQPAVASTRTSRAAFPHARSTTGSRAGSSASPFIRSSRATACSTPCTPSAAPGNPTTPDFIPPGFTRSDVTYHNVITEWHATNPAANTFDGHAARAAARGARRREPDASDGRRRVQPDGEARRRRTTACSTPAAAITGSATAADRTRAIPARRSGSTRS